MQTQLLHSTEDRSYTAPELIRLGSIRDDTGHCTSGCDHDSLDHPDEYKQATDDGCGGTTIEAV